MALPGLAMAFQIGSGVVGFLGNLMQGKAAKDAASYNAQIVNQDRMRNIRNAEIAEEDKRREDSRRLSEITNAFGNSGIDLAGSPLEVLQDVSTEMALDQNRIKDQGYVTNREASAKINSLRAEGSNAMKSAWISGFGSLLNGGTSATRSFLEAS